MEKRENSLRTGPARAPQGTRDDGYLERNLEFMLDTLPGAIRDPIDSMVRPQGYKTFFILDPTEHEIHLAHNWHFHYEIINGRLRECHNKIT